MNYTLESSANLQAVYEDKSSPQSVRLQAWHELKKRWQEQPRPMNSYSGQAFDESYYNCELRFMPQP